MEKCRTKGVLRLNRDEVRYTCILVRWLVARSHQYLVTKHVLDNKTGYTIIFAVILLQALLVMAKLKTRSSVLLALASKPEV